MFLNLQFSNEQNFPLTFSFVYGVAGTVRIFVTIFLSECSVCCLDSFQADVIKKNTFLFPITLLMTFTKTLRLSVCS
jgi:hypothetical protein